MLCFMFGSSEKILMAFLYSFMDFKKCESCNVISKSLGLIWDAHYSMKLHKMRSITHSGSKNSLFTCKMHAKISAFADPMKKHEQR